ncbi:MAG: SLC13 family permease [Oscillospiraceae bacterium]|nr:SLC13 family permease [Oscillospiraceae bacterium]MBR6207866.1 SLC13 family permease [Oscillospiraceae bacterium]
MKDTKKWVFTIIGVLLMLCGGFLPPIFGLSQLGMQIACIFVGTILLWMFVSVTWPSLLCIVALILTPLYTYSSALNGSMGGWITSFVLFSSMLTYVLRQTGFLRRVALWIVTRPFAKKNPWLLLGLLFFAPLFIGSFMSPIPAFIVCLPIAEQIFAELKYEKGDRFPQIVVLGILFFASLSTAATPIAHTVTTMALSLYENDMGAPINFVSYTIFGVISCLVIFFVALLLTKFVCRLDMDRLKNLDSSILNANREPMSRKEKWTLGVFVAVVAMWLLPGIIKGILPGVASAISTLGTPTPAIIGCILLCIIEDGGKPLMNWGESLAKGVPWGAVFMVAATSILGSALTNKDAGITERISSALSPVIGSMNPIVFVLFISLFTVIITNFASNTVTVTLMYSISLPLVYGGAIAGVNPAALTCVIGAGACVACATPPSTAHAAIAAGTGWLKTDTMLKYGLLWSVAAAILFAVVGYPIGAAIM